MLLVGCPSPGTNVSATDTVKIGFIAPLSGGDATLGQGGLNSAKLAIEQINAAGGVNGKQLELLVKDDAGDVEVGAAAAQDLKAKGVVAVIGPFYSGIAKSAVEQVLKAAGIPAIGPSTTSSALTSFDDGGLFFRTIASDAIQGKALSKLIRDNGKSKLAIFYRDNTYGSPFAEVLADDFASHSGHSAVKINYGDTDAPDYNALKSQIGDANAIALIGYTVDGTKLFRDWATAQEFSGLPWYFSESYRDSSFAENISDASKINGMMGTYPVSNGTHFAAFQADFKKRFGENAGYFTENTYDATMLIALAMAQGGANTSEAIKQNVIAVSKGGTKQNGIGSDGFKDAVSKIKSGVDLDFEGASGNVDLDDNGDVTTASYVVWKWQDGKPVNTDQILSF
mgnify:CR=1 FL=1